MKLNPQGHYHSLAVNHLGLRLNKYKNSLNTGVFFFLIIGCSGDFPVWQPRPKSFENLTRLLQLWSSTIFLSGPHSMLLASYTTPKQQQGNNHVGDKQAQCSVGVILLVFGTFTLYSWICFFTLWSDPQVFSTHRPPFCRFNTISGAHMKWTSWSNTHTHTHNETWWCGKMFPDHTHDGLCKGCGLKGIPPNTDLPFFWHYAKGNQNLKHVFKGRINTGITRKKKEEVNFGYKNLKFIWELQSCMALTGHALKGGKQLHQGTRYWPAI